MLQEILAEASLLSLGNNRLLIGYGKRKWLSEFASTEPSFYFPDFFLEESKPYCTHENILECSLDQFLSLLNSIPLEEQPSLFWNPINPHPFADTFQQLQKLFASGQLKKAVPYLFTSSNAKWSKGFLHHCLKHVASYGKDHNVSLYGYWTKNRALLGATPETLFCYNKKDKIVKTMACAATAPIHSIEQLSSQKNQYEHQLVIEGINQKLSTFGKLEQHPQEVGRFGALTHLITPISLHLEKQCSFSTLVQTLHPTPALGAYPEKEGKAWLLDYQTKVPRFHYGAPVALRYGEETRCLVAIRNLQWMYNQLMLGAGCGVIAESNFQEELLEIECKMKAIKGIFNL